MLRVLTSKWNSLSRRDSVTKPNERFVIQFDSNASHPGSWNAQFVEWFSHNGLYTFFSLLLHPFSFASTKCVERLACCLNVSVLLCTTYAIGTLFYSELRKYAYFRNMRDCLLHLLLLCSSCHSWPSRYSLEKCSSVILELVVQCIKCKEIDSLLVLQSKLFKYHLFNILIEQQR